MKVKKLNESVFEKLRGDTSVVNPVMGDAVKDHDLRQKAIEKVLSERGAGNQKIFTGSEKGITPKAIEGKPALEESLTDDVIEEAATNHDPTKPASDEWIKMGNDGKEKFDFWDKIYAELVEDSSFASTEARNKLRELPDPDPTRKDKGRYRARNIAITDDGDIRVNVVQEGDLKFAEDVAEHYKIPTEKRHSSRYIRYPNSLVLFISRMHEDADKITDSVLGDK